MNNKKYYLILSTLIVMNLLTGKVLAGEWTITPSVTVSETYSDNISLATSGSEQDDYVTQINPSIKINGKGKQLELDLDYTMQNIYYKNSTSSDEIRNQLSATANAILVEDLFFVDARASLRQQNTDLLGSGTQDNLSVVTDRADVQQISVSPYLQHNFANWFEGTARYSFTTTEYDQSVSDSESNDVSLALKSGEKFNKLKWSASYANKELDRDTESDIKQENIKGSVTYKLNHKFDAVVQGGDEDNDLGTGVTRANGGFWSAGFNYHPSYHLGLSMTAGDGEKTASVTVAPTRRTSLLVSVRDADVGLVIGEQWSGLMSHHTKRSTWQLRYLEDTTTSQTEALDSENFQFAGLRDGEAVYVYRGDNKNQPFIWTQEDWIAFGEDFPDAFPGGVPLTPLANEVYQREVLTASVNYKTGKSDITLSLSNQERFLEITNGTDTILTTGLSWNWRHSNRLASTLTTSWSQVEIDYTNPDSEYDLWSAGWDVTRTFTEKASASLGIRRAARETSSGAVPEYDENRVYISMQVKF